MQTCKVRCLRADHNRQTARRQINVHRRPRPLPTGYSICPSSWKTQYRCVRTLASHLISAKIGLAQPTTILAYAPTTAQRAIHSANCHSYASVSIVQTQARTRRSMRTLLVPRSLKRYRPRTARSLSRQMSLQRHEQIHQGPRCLTRPSASPSRRHRAHQLLRLFPNPACRSLLRSRAQAFIHLQQQRQVPHPTHLKV